MFGMDSSEWIRAAVGIAIVLANWFVYRGVALEESEDSWTKETGKILLRRALFAETLLALGLLFVNSWISIGQKAEIIRLQNHAAPRLLSETESALVISRLSKVVPADIGQIGYAFMASSDEEIALAIDLSDHVFSRIVWAWDDWPNNMLAPVSMRLPAQGKVIGSLIPLNGVQIQVLNPELSEIEGVLVGALRDAGLENVRSDPRLDAWLQSPNKAMLIIIMIGMRPPLKLAE